MFEMIDFLKGLILIIMGLDPTSSPSTTSSRNVECSKTVVLQRPSEKFRQLIPASEGSSKSLPFTGSKVFI